ncbi:recombinase family protein [Rubellimicrobium aerolatum]|uniref:Recombinase family protein n=1 Tax=Rubellimicrobium aerolatum TaxID=490979 RepID=A0ABW0SF68_9RHOB|nr:recombinase family protein [Rubellimicrobium aerolatum]
MPDRRRACIYARFSTDLQSDRSIDDQVALCRAYAAREGLTVVTTYSDRARTSASLIGRDGLQDLMADARAGKFDVLVVEAFDRLSRDQEDLAGIHKRLDFLRIPILAVNDGRADAIQIGVHGLLGQIWMDGHKKKVRRGMAGVIRGGRHAGGRAYGYRPLPGQPGELEIVEAEAEVIRRIFAAYAVGTSARAIAAELNGEGVPPPRGPRWNASTLIGNHARGHGLLRNELYKGIQVWNRITMVRDPDTGRRVSRTNPESEWQRSPAPHLRIVEDALYDRVQLSKADRAQSGARGRALTRPLRPFSGLLRCGCCGAGMSISNRRGTAILIRCSRSVESGTCANRRQVRLDRIEAAVFARLREELEHPAYLREYLRVYHGERQRLASAARRDKAQLGRAATKARAAFDRAHKLYIDGVTDGPAAEANIRRLLDEARAAEIALAQAEAEVPVVELHPAALARYIDALADLAPSLAAPTPPAQEAVAILRELISAVVVTPEESHVDVVMHGYMAMLLGRDRLDCRGLMVAEEGFEPPTHGL